MKRRYKLLLIIIIGIILTIIISYAREENKVSITALGDGFSLGMTPYNVAGISFNDYLKDKIEALGKLDTFNNEFSINHLTVHELNEYLEENTKGKFTNKPIKQVIAASTIVTISIGLDELADKSLIENINETHIDNYISEMNLLLRRIREFYNQKIVVISLYEAYNFKMQDAIELNNQLKKICGKYNASFLDVLAISLKSTYYLETSSYYLNYKAHSLIADYLYQEIKNSI